MEYDGGLPWGRARAPELRTTSLQSRPLKAQPARRRPAPGHEARAPGAARATSELLLAAPRRATAALRPVHPAASPAEASGPPVADAPAEAQAPAQCRSGTASSRRRNAPAGTLPLNEALSHRRAKARSARQRHCSAKGARNCATTRAAAATPCPPWQRSAADAVPGHRRKRTSPPGATPRSHAAAA